MPYADIPYSVNDSDEHQALALEATRKSIVLLKNQGGLLPLTRDIGTIAVIGPNADEVDVLLGNYNGIPSDPVTPLRGIREKVEPGMEVLFARGARLAEGLPRLEPVPLEVLRTPVLRAAAAGDGAQDSGASTTPTGTSKAASTPPSSTGRPPSAGLVRSPWKAWNQATTASAGQGPSSPM